MARGQSGVPSGRMGVRGSSKASWDGPFRRNHRRTCIGQPIERLASAALRKPFPEAPEAADPAAWNWEEAADGVLLEGSLVLGMVGWNGPRHSH